MEHAYAKSQTKSLSLTASIELDEIVLKPSFFATSFLSMNGVPDRAALPRGITFKFTFDSD